MTQPTKSEGHHELAARAWRHLFDLLMATGAHRSQVLEQHGLTPNDSKALSSLDAEPGKPMRSLAQLWGTDASNATWVVDRLEQRGLAERRPDPKDRRVKLVALTQKGQETKRSLLDAFYEPPPELMAMEDTDLHALLGIFSQIPSGRSPGSR